MIKSCKSLLMAALAAAVVAASGIHATAQQHGGMLRITTAPEPTILSNALSSVPSTNEIGTKIFEGLLEYDKDFNPQPSLAESWVVSDDGLSVTFDLRKGVVWHDGKPFTSADVHFSLTDLIKNYHPQGKGNLGAVVDVETPDEHTAIVKLAHPSVPFMRALSSLSIPIVAKHVYEGTDYRNNPTNVAPIGTGPFKFAEWVKGSHVRLEKNENYWREGRPYLDGMIFRFIPDSATRSAALESGEIDVATFGTINPVEMRRLESLDHLSIAAGGYEAIAPLMLLEVNGTRAPLDNKNFRLGLAYAIDREMITKNVWFGFGKPAVGPITSFLERTGAFTREGVRDFTVSDRLEIAAKLFDEAGYPLKDGSRAKLTLDVVPYGEDWRRMGEVIRQQLARVGIEIELRTGDNATFMRQVYNENDYDLAMMWYLGMSDPTIGVQRNYWSKNINPGVPFGNVSRYSNPEVDALWEKAQVEADDSKRNEYFHELQRKIVDDSPLIWIMEKDLVAVQNNRVRDLITDPYGVRGGLYGAWIEQ